MQSDLREHNGTELAGPVSSESCEPAITVFWCAPFTLGKLLCAWEDCIAAFVGLASDLVALVFDTEVWLLDKWRHV